MCIILLQRKFKLFSRHLKIFVSGIKSPFFTIISRYFEFNCLYLLFLRTTHVYLLMFPHLKIQFSSKKLYTCKHFRTQTNFILEESFEFHTIEILHLKRDENTQKNLTINNNSWTT